MDNGLVIDYTIYFFNLLFIKSKKLKEWISRDLPLGNGDFEDLKNILSENPNLNCANPTEL